MHLSIKTRLKSFSVTVNRVKFVFFFPLDVFERKKDLAQAYEK